MAAAPAHRDRLGLALTAAGGEAARALDDAIWAYVGFSREPGVPLKRALQADPAMPMANILQGYFMHLMGQPHLVPAARAAHATAAKTPMTPRERAHLAALGAWCDGELERAAVVLDAVLADHPRDYLALKIANYLYFYLGNAANVRDGPARALEHWDEGLPGYGHLLALHAFGLEESGDYAAAERQGRRATELNPADPWAVHAVAHVMEMQDRAAEGVRWIGEHAPACEGTNFFRHHLWWHLALMHWVEGRIEDALRLYDERVWAEGSSENLSLCNDISMLARLELAGAEVGDRWRSAAEVVREQSGGGILAFVDAHYALATGALPRGEARGATARVNDTVGRALCDALVAWRSGGHARVVRLLQPVLGELWRIGGSHAQRDLFTLLLVDAARRSGNDALARGLLGARNRAVPPYFAFGTRPIR